MGEQQPSIARYLHSAACDARAPLILENGCRRHDLPGTRFLDKSYDPNFTRFSARLELYLEVLRIATFLLDHAHLHHLLNDCNMCQRLSLVFTAEHLGLGAVESHRNVNIRIMIFGSLRPLADGREPPLPPAVPRNSQNRG